MDCAIVREQLRDLVRGRTAPAEASELRRHLAGCDACRHEEAAERLLDEALAARLPRPATPGSLRREIARRFEPNREEAAPPTRPLRPATRIAAASMAALALAAVGYVAGRAGQEQAGGARLTDELVTDHLRSLASAHPHDVESTSSHEVKPWFEGRLDLAPVVPGDRGELRLLGGSVGYVADRKAAVVSYGLRRHRVTLLVFPRAGVPGLEGLSAAGAPVRTERRGFTVALWASGDLGYALVADVSPDELGRLADELAPETRRSAR
jgi:anti-sigma factor RsiW